MNLKWISYVINTVAFLIIAVSLFMLLAMVLTPAGQVPQVMGFSLLRVLTDSMEPEIPAQSMLVVQAVDPQTLEVGDVITFFSSDPTLNGALNTHRIVRIETPHSNLQFATKGDTNESEDPQLVPASQVVGKVIHVSPIFGKAVGLITTPLVFGLVILVPLTAVLAASLLGDLRRARRDRKKDAQEPENPAAQ